MEVGVGSYCILVIVRSNLGYQLMDFGLSLQDRHLGAAVWESPTGGGPMAPPTGAEVTAVKLKTRMNKSGHAWPPAEIRSNGECDDQSI